MSGRNCEPIKPRRAIFSTSSARSRTIPTPRCWAARSHGINTIYERVAATPEPEKAAIAAWIRATFAPAYAKLPAPSANDSPNTREMRAQLFGLLGYYAKDHAVLAQAREITEKYLADQSSVDATLGQTALAVAARNGDAAFFDQLQKIYETSTNPGIAGERAAFAGAVH